MVVLLTSVGLRNAVPDGERAFPFSVPAIRTLPTIPFRTPVTLFVGENGSGKSTLLEAIAAATGLPAVGGELRVDGDESLRAQRLLSRRFALTWTKRRATRGFFLRAEDFFGFTKTLKKMRTEFEREIADVELEYADREPLAKGLRLGPIRASLGDMERRYGLDLDANSHGQSFLQLFRSRFVPDGLYLLDEPEAPLSPQSQLAFIAMLKDMVTEGSQFIIATHSPILLAFPGATIFTFDEPPVREVAFGDLAHVNLTRDFLADPERYLRLL